MSHFRTKLISLAILLLAVGLLAQQSPAQVLYGTLIGNVQDEKGAVVSGATVTVTNKGTGQVKETTTNDLGDYSFRDLQAGTYEVKVSMTGFATVTKTNIEISTNNVTRIDIQLKVGQVSDTVEVTAEATLLQTDTAEVKSRLNSKAIEVLPMARYRNYQSLINLVPGATPAGFQNANTDTPARALTTNINGTNRNNNNTRLDGATNVFIWLPHHTVYVAPAETIQEVNITTSSYDAEQGMAGGAAITVQTKSGTNEIHGSLFALHNNQTFNAKNVFRPAAFPKKDKSITNIDGFTIGGPIKRDKLFYFGGWEGMRERVGKFALFNVPTEAMRRGDFSAFSTIIYDPDTGTVDGRNRTPFLGNIIPPNRISPIAKKLIDLTPLPNLPGSGAFGVTQNFFNSATQVMNRDNIDIKINWNRATSHQIWGKYSIMDAQVEGQFGLNQAGGPCLCEGGNGVGDTFVQVATIGHTWTIRPNVVVDGNFGFTRMGQQVLGPDFGKNIGLDVLGIPGTNGPDIRQSGFPQFAISGFTTLGNVNNWSPIFRTDQSFTGTTNLGWLKRNHDLRFGFDLVRHHLNHWQPEIGVGPRGQLNFNGGATSINGVTPQATHGYAQFLLGVTSSVEKSLQHELMTGREWQLGWYVRDRWQATRNLTVTLGLRYELYPLITRADRGIERLDIATMKVLLGRLGGNPDNVGVEVSHKLFAPRFGLAYRLGDSTVIRSGYGITYNPMPFSRPLRGFFPLTIAASFVSTVPGANATFTPFGTLAQGIPPFSGPDLSKGVVDLPPNVDMRTPPNGLIHRGYIQSWNFTIERKLPADFVVSAGYVGTQTTHQLADLDINAAGPGQGNTGRPFFRNFGRTAPTRFWDGWLSSNYHSLQVAINRSFTRGLFVKGAYTYSKAINWTDDDGWAGVTFNHPSALHMNRGLAGYDRTHMLQMGFAAELPFGKGKRWANSGAASTIIGNWQVNGIFSSLSGTPFTVAASGASLNAPGNGQTADQVKAEVKKLGGTGAGASFFDPFAFKPVTEVRFGNTSRNILRGPGMVNLDFSIFRIFPITEGTRLEFRVEAFNFTNTPHFNNPGANVSSLILNADGTIRSLNGFTEITSARDDSRQFRFGLRFTF